MTERIQHDLIQNTPAWEQFRLEHHGASEAAAMLGLSKNVTRTELLRMKHTGIAKEFSDFVQEKILDHGHEVEALARTIVEYLISDDLYPCTYSYGKLSASCDGLTMDGLTAFEHKQWNSELAASVRLGKLPEEHWPQCQQVLLVTDAAKLIFVVSDGTKDNFESIVILRDEAWFHKLDLGWIQFDADLAAYQPVEVLPPATAAPVMALPALSIQVQGSISLVDNLAVFGEKLTAFIEHVPTKPETDNDFAEAEQAIKVLETAQNALEAAESSALAQVATVDEMRRTVALYAGQARSTRLMLTKLVAARKDQIRVEIVQKARNDLLEHFITLNKRLGKNYMQPVGENFAGVIKGKKTVASLHDAVDTELARCKIDANAMADSIQINLNSLRELAKDHAFLFADTAQLVLKANDDLVALIKVRIAEHTAAEQKRLDAERERIRIEEQAKAERAERIKQQAETDRLAKVEAEQKAAAVQDQAAPKSQAKRNEDMGSHAPSSAPAAAPSIAAAQMPEPVRAGAHYSSSEQNSSVAAATHIDQLLDREGLIRSFMLTQRGTTIGKEKLANTLREFCAFVDKFKTERKTA